MTALEQILSQTPVWVWPLLGLLLWLGWRDLRPRAVPPWRLAILPVAASGIALAGVATSPRPATALVAWLAVFVAALPAGTAIAARRRIGVDGARLSLAGSWFSMALGLTVFTLRFAMGVAGGRNPALASDLLWIVAGSALGGAVAGLGVGWLAGLLRRYRRARQASTELPRLHPLHAT
jgi:hypothetical protein